MKPGTYRFLGSEAFDLAALNAVGGASLTPIDGTRFAQFYIHNEAAVATARLLVNFENSTPTVANGAQIPANGEPIILYGDLAKMKFKNKTAGDCIMRVVYLQ